MKQNATKLPPKQAKALDALIAGRTSTQAASDAGVHRSTLYRWLDEAESVASLNARRSELRAAAEARLEHIQAKALDTLEASLEKGDARVALAVLKGTGFLGGEKAPIGPATSEGAAMSLASARRSRDRRDLLGSWG